MRRRRHEMVLRGRNIDIERDIFSSLIDSQVGCYCDPARQRRLARELVRKLFGVGHGERMVSGGSSKPLIGSKRRQSSNRSIAICELKQLSLSLWVEPGSHQDRCESIDADVSIGGFAVFCCGLGLGTPTCAGGSPAAASTRAVHAMRARSIIFVPD